LNNNGRHGHILGYLLSLGYCSVPASCYIRRGLATWLFSSFTQAINLLPSPLNNVCQKDKQL